MPLQKNDFEAGWYIVHKWARRNALRGERRTVSPLFAAEVSGSPLVLRFLALVIPWTVSEYPARSRVINAICGRSDKAHGLLSRWSKKGIPAESAEKLAAFLESRIVREQALVSDLRAHAERWRRERPVPYFAQVSWQEMEIITRRSLATRRARWERRAAEREREAAMIAEVVGIRDAGQ